MESKHTPGPWWMAATGEANGIGYAIGAGNCEIGHMAERGDALLAKAAPEMLAALVMLRNTLGDLRNGFARSVDPARWVEQAQAVADAAIAKAEGRE